MTNWVRLLTLSMIITWAFISNQTNSWLCGCSECLWWIQCPLLVFQSLHIMLRRSSNWLWSIASMTNWVRLLTFSMIITWAFISNQTNSWLCGCSKYLWWIQCPLLVFQSLHIMLKRSFNWLWSTASMTNWVRLLTLSMIIT